MCSGLSPVVLSTPPGPPIDTDGDNIFDNRLLGTEKGGFTTDRFYQLDFRIAKVFNLGGRASATALIEIFNVFNRDNPRDVNRLCADTNGDGLPDIAGCSAPSVGEVTTPFPGREIQIGFRVGF